MADKINRRICHGGDFEAAKNSCRGRVSVHGNSGTCKLVMLVQRRRAHKSSIYLNEPNRQRACKISEVVGYIDKTVGEHHEAQNSNESKLN